MIKRTRLIMAAGAALVLATILAAYASNEIIINLYMKVSNEDFEKVRNISSYKIDQNDTGMSASIQDFGTSTWELISIVADVNTNGYSLFRTITTNRAVWIELATSNATGFVEFSRLRGGDPAILPLAPSVSLYGRGGRDSTNDPSVIKLETWVNEK